VSEKSITRQRVGLVKRAKTSLRDPADLAGVRSGDKFVVSRVGEAYDAQARGPNRKFQLRAPDPFLTPPVVGWNLPQAEPAH